MITCSAAVVLEFGLNAHCVDDIMLCLVMCVMSCDFMIVSCIFAIIGNSDIGR